MASLLTSPTTDKDLDVLDTLPPVKTLSTPVEKAWAVVTVTAEEIIVEGLRALNTKQIDLYTTNPRLGDQLAQYNLPHVFVHLDLRSSYPERRLFQQSKAIAENWLQRLQAIRPEAFMINDLAQDKSVDYYRLAIRRMVISHIYFELCYCQWMIEEFKQSDASTLVIMAEYLSQEDFKQVLADMPAGKTVHFKVNTLFYRFYQNMGRWNVMIASPKTQGLSFLKYPTRYLAFLYQELKAATDNMLMYSMANVKIPKPVQQLIARSLKTNVKPQPNTIHVASGSLSLHNVHYYTMVYVPLFKKLISQGYTIDYVFFTMVSVAEGQQVKDTFREIMATYGVDVSKVTIQSLHYDASRRLTNRYAGNISSTHTNCHAVLASPSLTIEQKCILTTLDRALDVYRKVLMNWLRYMQKNPIQLLLTLEHDMDEASILKRLSMLVTPERPLTNIVLPSCLPEYCEVYDCVDVDTLYTHHKQVEKLFTDQDVNARDLRVSGSTEWEEQPPESAKFDDETQALIDRSDIVMGIFHQPLFLTFHQKEIYDGLIVDFNSIYERFLAEHPNGCMLIKPHRADDLDAIRAFIPQSDRIRILAKDTSNQLMYRSIDVALSIHSTTVVHTIAHGVPMLCLYKYPDYTHFYDFVDQMGCLATNSQDAIFTWLRNFTSDTDFKASVLKTLHAYRDHNKANPASTMIMQQINELLPIR